MIIILFLLFFFLNSNSKILAVTKNPSPTPTQIPNEQPNQDTKNTGTEEVQKIREAVQKKVQEKLKEITTTTSTKKGIIGSVIQINETEIILSHKNVNQKISISPDTVFIDSKRNKTQFTKIKVGQDLLVMGTINENKVLEATRIVFINIKDLEIKYTTVIGTIVDISKSSPFFVLVPVNNKDIQYQIKTDSLTDMVNKNNQKFDFKNLSLGQKVVVVIKPDNKTSKTYYVSKIITLSPSPSTAQ